MCSLQKYFMIFCFQSCVSYVNRICFSYVHHFVMVIRDIGALKVHFSMVLPVLEIIDISVL